MLTSGINASASKTYGILPAPNINEKQYANIIMTVTIGGAVLDCNTYPSDIMHKKTNAEDEIIKICERDKTD